MQFDVKPRGRGRRRINRTVRPTNKKSDTSFPRNARVMCPIFLAFFRLKIKIGLLVANFYYSYRLSYCKAKL